MARQRGRVSGLKKMKSVEIRREVIVPLIIAACTMLVERNSGLQKTNQAISRRPFNAIPALNPAKKHALAEQLNLKPRQVEVWFQNRRARTKLKQTEADYEVLKRCCESLSNENRRLKREVQELRSQQSGRSSSSLHSQLAKDGTATKCPSCEESTTTDQKNW
ncbi:hypothetical protein OIU79_012916 [Salix purpurea]|uniref:Homeobox domain-containing protein n=1 Tax=Salix purpurea TaxID=77065 RepID=A0A9Q0Q4D8_SALPP|nr:hypothetical protein OIU79_012916 [Salix purpurea]